MFQLIKFLDQMHSDLKKSFLQTKQAIDTIFFFRREYRPY